jgi:predicted nuclease of predicted toxin-antitoxin system
MQQRTNGSSSLEVATFWDLKNIRPISPATPSHLTSFASSMGEISQQFVVSNWQLENRNSDISLVSELNEQGFTTITIPPGRNKADEKLIDCCKRHALNNFTVQTVILITQDGDFTSLVKELKQHHKKVILVGRSWNATSKSLRKLVDSQIVVFYTLFDIECQFNNSLDSSNAA